MRMNQAVLLKRAAAVALAVGLAVVGVTAVMGMLSERRSFYTDLISGSVKEKTSNRLQVQEAMLYQAPNFDPAKARWQLGVRDTLGTLKSGEWLVLTNRTARTAIMLESFEPTSGAAVMVVYDEDGGSRRRRETNWMSVRGGYLLWRGGDSRSMVILSPLISPSFNSTAILFPVAEDFALAFATGKTNAQKMFMVGPIN